MVAGVTFTVLPPGDFQFNQPGIIEVRDEHDLLTKQLDIAEHLKSLGYTVVHRHSEIFSDEYANAFRSALLVQEQNETVQEKRED